MDQPRIEEAVRSILAAFGEEDRSGLEATPARVARMYEEVLSGVGSDPGAEIDVTFPAGSDDLILVRDIPLVSFCEHHLLPFIGKAHVGYVPHPDGRITGLSKLARVVDVAARRLQTQERLTAQIADVLTSRLDPRGVIVVVEAEHLCMTIRGVRTPGAVVVTTALRGVIRDEPAMRQEALRLIRGG